MARITVEDCLTRVDNRFSLVHLAARRVRQLKKGEHPLIKCKNREVVTALREIAGGDVNVDTLREIEEAYKKNQDFKLPPPGETQDQNALSDLSAAISEEMAELIPDDSLTEESEEAEEGDDEDNEGEDDYEEQE